VYEYLFLLGEHMLDRQMPEQGQDLGLAKRPLRAPFAVLGRLFLFDFSVPPDEPQPYLGTVHGQLLDLLQL
jgi:hypothetical protein